MLYKTKYIESIYQEEASKYLVVTFNAMNMRSNGKRFWGDSFLKKNGVSALGIVSTSPNWFPRVAMEELVEAVRPILSRYEHICTYGTSMGAYGAIKYSGLLGAQTAVAFSPQHTIDPSYENVPSQFSACFNPELHQEMTIQANDLRGGVFLFYDPFHLPDLCAANHIAAMGEVERIPVPFVGHTTIQIFAKENKGMNVLRFCMERKMKELRKWTYEARRSSPLRPHQVACGLVSKHIRWAFAICEKYPDVLEDKRLDSFCHALKRHQKVDLAVQWTRDGISKNSQSARYHRNLAAFLRLKGDLQSALSSIDQAIVLNPHSHQYVLEAGVICRDAKHTSEAVKWFLKAIEMFPKDPTTFITLAGFFQDNGNLDRALETLRNAQVYHPYNSSIIEKIHEIKECANA